MRKLLTVWGEAMKAEAREMRSEKGSMNIGAVLMMGIGMIFVAVGFIFLPIATDATDAILTYAYTSNNSITDATFTGLTAITGIVPLLILLGFVAQAVLAGFLGIKAFQGAGEVSMNKGGLLMSGLSIVFIALGLIMFPIVLDGAAGVYHGGGQGLSASYSGFSSFLLMSPMLVLLGFIASSVLSGFFGIKSLSGKD